MRRLGVVLTCLVLAPGLAGLAGCSTADSSTPPSATSTVSRLAGGEETPALGPGRMAYFLLEGVFQGAGAQGYTFLSDLLTGDGKGVSDEATMAKLDGIGSQLTQITTRLDTIDSDLGSLRAEITDATLRGQLDQMNQWNNSMITLYQEYFLPVLDAAKEVSAAKADIDAFKTSCGGAASSGTPSATASATATATTTACATTPVPANLTKALADKVSALDAAKQSFKTKFDLTDPYTTAANQHDELYPKNPDVSSVLKLAGLSMESRGYVTWADSQKLNNLYLALSDQEALSAMMVFEHDKMFDAPVTTQARHQSDYKAFNDIERANLSPEIPWGQVKVGQQMFMVPPDPQHEAYGAWLPISPEGKQLGTFDPLVKEAENPGWSLPNDTQLTALYGATKATPIVDTVLGTESQGPSTHLGSIWKHSGNDSILAPSPITKEQAAIYAWGRPWYWTNDTGQSNAMEEISPITSKYVGYRHYTLHHIGYMAGDAFEIQGQPGRIPDKATCENAQCDATIISMYENDTYSGNVMLTQPIPDGVDYMAQRSTALPALSAVPPATTTGS